VAIINTANGRRNEAVRDRGYAVEVSILPKNPTILL